MVIQAVSSLLTEYAVAGQAPSLHVHYTLPRYYEPVRLPAAAPARLLIPVRICWPVVRTQSPQHGGGSPGFRDRSFHTRCPQPPRQARRVQKLITSPPILGFFRIRQFGRLQFRVTRPNRVRWRYGSRDRRARLRGQHCCYDARSRGYLSNEQLQGWDFSPNQISPALPGAPEAQRFFSGLVKTLLRSVSQCLCG